MQSTANHSLVRVAGVVLALVLAAGAGLAAGSVLNGRDQAQLNAGYPAGWQGGAAVPAAGSDAHFSLDAIEAVQAARGDQRAATAPASVDYADYGIRHAPAFDPSEAKKNLAKPTLR